MTLGGIDTDELDQRSLEAKKCPACTSSAKWWT